MSDSNQTNPQDKQRGKVLDLVHEIAGKSASAEFFFRGEPESYPRVSSSLYRVFEKNITAEQFDIEIVQKEILDKAKQFSHGTDGEILTELQHFGGKTNLIDFTTDYNIALFFACDGSYNKDGRIIFNEIEKIKGQVLYPRNPENRVIAQKSVFVRPLRGFIEADVVFNVPKELKLTILTFLRKSHGISTESIYNDLHGFIRYQEIHQRANTEFYLGLECFNKGHHDEAVCHYTKAIEFNPQDPNTYNNRGFANYKKDDADRAIKDFNMAIQLNPRHSKAFVNRGVVWLSLKEWEKATSDLNAVKEMGADIIALFRNVHASVEDFEQEIGVNLPEDIASMLTPPHA